MTCRRNRRLLLLIHRHGGCRRCGLDLVCRQCFSCLDGLVVDGKAYTVTHDDYNIWRMKGDCHMANETKSLLLNAYLRSRIRIVHGKNANFVQKCERDDVLCNHQPSSIMMMTMLFVLVAIALLCFVCCRPRLFHLFPSQRICC